MHVAVPALLDTGVIVERDGNTCKVRLDVTTKIEAYNFADVRVLRWVERKVSGDFLYVVKAWNWILMDRRKIRIQCHKIREDGSIGPRVIIRERVNGRVVRE